MKNQQKQIKDLHEQLRHSKTPHVLIADIGESYVLDSAVGSDDLDLIAILFTAQMLFRLGDEGNAEFFGKLSELFKEFGSKEELATLARIAAQLANEPRELH